MDVYLHQLASHTRPRPGVGREIRRRPDRDRRPRRCLRILLPALRRAPASREE